MDKLKTHLKQYGMLHLVAIFFITGSVWQVVNDYKWVVQHKTDWQTMQKVLLFHATFISLYFAVWVGRAVWIWVEVDPYRKNKCLAGKIFLSTTLGTFAWVMTFLACGAVLQNFALARLPH